MRTTNIIEKICGDYSIVVEIKDLNKQSEGCKESKFHCGLWLEDNPSGVRILIKEDVTLTSTVDFVEDDISRYLHKLIENGYFKNDVEMIENFLDVVCSVRSAVSK